MAEGYAIVIDMRKKILISSIVCIGFAVFIILPAVRERIIENITQDITGGSDAPERIETPVSDIRPVSHTKLLEPIPDFSKRVSKKPFGIYVTPESSPIQPERFIGYHTGADAEIASDELQKNFFVKAVADGDVVLVRSAAGYGGLVVIQHTIDESKKLYGMYGHIRFSSILIKARDHVKAGDVIGVLGDHMSEETGGERKHLHFGLYQGETPDIRGYVSSQEELKNWINPLQFF